MKPGETIRSRRGALGLTQEQLADALDVTAAAVSKWENSLSRSERDKTPTLTLFPGSVYSTRALTAKEKRQS